MCKVLLTSLIQITNLSENPCTAYPHLLVFERMQEFTFPFVLSQLNLRSIDPLFSNQRPLLQDLDGFYNRGTQTFLARGPDFALEKIRRLDSNIVILVGPPQSSKNRKI